MKGNSNVRSLDGKLNLNFRNSEVLLTQIISYNQLLSCIIEI